MLGSLTKSGERLILWNLHFFFAQSKVNAKKGAFPFEGTGALKVSVIC